jgi:hypothetical protein
MRFFRCFGVLAGLATACTAPIESESLPAADPSPTPTFHAQSAPVTLEQRPPLQMVRLLATSPDHPRWAVSDGQRLWIADGDEAPVEQRHVHVPQLRSIAIDHEGNLWLLDKDDGLARQSADGHVEPLSLPPIERIDMLALGAKRVVLLGRMREGLEPPPNEDPFKLDERYVLAISDDGGHEWRLRRRPFNLREPDDLRIAPDGSIQLMDAFAVERDGDQERWTSHLDQPGWKQLEWPLELDAIVDHYYAGADGWSYGLVADAGLHAVDRDGAVHLVRSTTRHAFVHDGRTGVLLTPDGMWSVTGREAKRIGDPAPLEHLHFIEAMAIAHDGALVLTHEHSVFIGAATGWRSFDLEGGR